MRAEKSMLATSLPLSGSELRDTSAMSELSGAFLRVVPPGSSRLARWVPPPYPVLPLVGLKDVARSGHVGVLETLILG